MRIIPPIALLLILGCHDAAPPSADEAFSVNGKPIPPACVYELLESSISAVDVERSGASPRHAEGRISRSADGWRYENTELMGEGFFCYWWLGVTPAGTHAVLTADNGGGSGIFYRVLFLTLKKRSYFDETAPVTRWVLSCVGEVALGDRTRDRAELESSTLVVRPPTGEPRRIPIPVF